MSKPSQKSKPKSICDQVKEKNAKAAKAKPAARPKQPTQPLIEFPHFLRKIGPTQIKTFIQFMPSVAVWSVVSFLGVTYASDWKAVLQYLPYYNGKYVEEIDVKEEPEEQEEEK